MRLLCILSLLLVCLAGVSVSAATCPTNSGIPFKLYRGYVVVVRGSIGAVEKLNFIVDTAAVPSVVDERVVRKLNLRGSETSVSTFTREAKTMLVRAPDMRVGPIHAGQIDVLARDLSGISQTLGMRVDAMIGFDLLGRAAFTIDYRCKRLIFGQVDSSWASVPYKAGLAYPLIELAVQGGRVSVVVDTGASGLVLFDKTAEPYLSGARRRGAETWSNLGGDVQVRKIEIPQLALGASAWSDRKAFVLEHAEGPSGVHGLLGPMALGLERIAFDPERATFSWSGQ
ncbi:MAG TPA: aspartyl protease family protein [Terriglobales bacterium]|nr:aspartyl protease family protein [Terriglobales bacterium]